MYLPEDYQNSQKNYPIIHLHDVQNLFDTATSYTRECDVDDYLYSLTNNQSIIIGIYQGNKVYFY